MAVKHYRIVPNNGEIVAPTNLSAVKELVPSKPPELRVPSYSLDGSALRTSKDKTMKTLAGEALRDRRKGK